MNESENTAADSTGADNAESGSAGSSDSTGSKEQEAGATEQQTSAKKSSGENVKEVVPETASTYTVKDYTDDDSEPVEISLRTLMRLVLTLDIKLSAGIRRWPSTSTARVVVFTL